MIRIWWLVFVSSVPAVFASPPNVVLIVADDLGYADVSFHPDHALQVQTPRLEALARESIVFRQGYVSGNVCSPTRAGLMTGRYQQRLGLYTGGEAGSGLPMTEPLFPRFLRPAGYVCGQFGKWHLGPTPPWSPAHRGFDEVFGFLGRGAHDYFKLDDPEDPIYRGTTPVHETGYLTDRLGEEAAAFIRTHRERPFFVYLAFNAVHAPLQAPAEDIARFDTGDVSRNTRLAMGFRLDQAVGTVLDALEESGVRENTLVAFLSDNGGPLAQGADNGPWRGGKHEDFEGGIRVPFLLSWPSRLPPGVSDTVVSSLDLLPTALAAAGIPSPADRPFDGLNLLPVLEGTEPAPRRDLFWSNGESGGWWAVRSGDWKLVCDHGAIALFDLASDPSETRDLASARPEQVATLRALHEAWLEGMAPPIKGGAKRIEPGTPRRAKRSRQEPRRD
jgi:arylsulfatase A-like enzyme